MMYNTGMQSGAAPTAPRALAVEGSQPVWMTLDDARERMFTGEVVFELDPEVLAYFDNGVVYYAERATDASLARRLVDAGVLDEDQLARGTVRVGDVEHLGRLFDRDDTVDRDAVLVVTETSTEDLITDLANREIAAVRVTAYRHHPSGVHRWFVAPRDSVGPARPVTDVPQLGTNAVEDLPGITFLDDGELLIEWDEPVDGFDQTESPFAVDEFELDLTDEALADVEPVEAFADAAGDDEHVDDDLAIVEMDHEPDTADEIEVDPGAESVAGTDATGFAVVWPDGSEVEATEPAAASVTEVPEVVAPVAVLAAPAAPVPLTRAPDGALRFEMPALALRDEPDVEDAEVPDEVAEAVRRAIAAIESATSEVPVITPATAPDGSVTATAEPAAAPAFAGFAPPTLDMRAEVVYERMAAEQDALDARLDSEPSHAVESFVAANIGLAESVAPAAGVASVVFVDDETSAGGGDERASALRRLIGSLRRKER